MENIEPRSTFIDQLAPSGVSFRVADPTAVLTGGGVEVEGDGRR